MLVHLDYLDSYFPFGPVLLVINSLIYMVVTFSYLGLFEKIPHDIHFDKRGHRKGEGRSIVS